MPRIVREVGRLPAGHAVITTAEILTAKFVIHTVGPIYRGGEGGEAETLAACYREWIRLADEHPAFRPCRFLRYSTGRIRISCLGGRDRSRSALQLTRYPRPKHVSTVRFVLFDIRT